MLHQLPTLLLIASLLPTAFSITTIQAYLAPERAAASVLAVADGATTYSIQCTKGCAANAENNQATLVNGPSTAGFTQIMGGSGRTLILDCKLLGENRGDCATKAISAGETRTVKETLTFKEMPVVITAGLEKLGYVVVQTTLEVNTTVTARRTSKVASSTATATLTESDSSTITEESSTSSRTSSGSASITLATAAGTTQSTSSSAAAAPTMKAEFVGGAIVGLAGVLLAVL